MKLYDACFEEVDRLLGEYPGQRLEFHGTQWPDGGRNQLIFKNDTACELGAGTLPALSGIALTCREEFVPRDEIILCGEDLSQLEVHTPYARLALIRVREEFMGRGDALYQAIRRIEYTRYHVSPQGFMLRASVSGHRESVRVSRQAVENGMSFSHVGESFLRAYHAHPEVEAVRLIFVTRSEFPYDRIKGIVQRSEDVTKALDHVMKNIKMDCATCGLKEICAEVEDLYRGQFSAEE